MAAAIVAQRWMWDYMEGRSNPGDGLLLFNYRYGAVEFAMREIVGRAGARIVLAPLRFPCLSEDELLETLDHTLRREKPTYAVLDHILSQVRVTHRPADPPTCANPPTRQLRPVYSTTTISRPSRLNLTKITPRCLDPPRTTNPRTTNPRTTNPRPSRRSSYQSERW